MTFNYGIKMNLLAQKAMADYTSEWAASMSDQVMNNYSTSNQVFIIIIYLWNLNTVITGNHLFLNLYTLQRWTAYVNSTFCLLLFKMCTSSMGEYME